MNCSRQGILVPLLSPKFTVFPVILTRQIFKGSVFQKVKYCFRVFSTFPFCQMTNNIVLTISNSLYVLIGFILWFHTRFQNFSNGRFPIVSIHMKSHNCWIDLKVSYCKLCKHRFWGLYKWNKCYHWSRNSGCHFNPRLCEEEEETDEEPKDVPPKKPK